MKYSHFSKCLCVRNCCRMCIACTCRAPSQPVSVNLFLISPVSWPYSRLLKCLKRTCDEMSSDNPSTVPEDVKRCSDCHHCIDIRWTEKITCLAYLDVRHPVNVGECPEFMRRRLSRPSRLVSMWLGALIFYTDQRRLLFYIGATHARHYRRGCHFVVAAVQYRATCIGHAAGSYADTEI